MCRRGRRSRRSTTACWPSLSRSARTGERHWHGCGGRSDGARSAGWRPTWRCSRRWRKTGSSRRAGWPRGTWRAGSRSRDGSRGKREGSRSRDGSRGKRGGGRGGGAGAGGGGGGRGGGGGGGGGRRGGSRGAAGKVGSAVAEV